MYEMKKGSVQSSHILESVIHFVVELVRMQCSSPILFLYCLKKLWLDRTFHHVQMIALLVESLGPLMLYIEEMRGIMNKELEHIHSVCNAKLVSADSSILLMNAYYTCRPDERPAIKRVEIPPQQRYLQYLLGEQFEKAQSRKDLQRIVGCLKGFNVTDDTTLLLLVHEILQVPARSALLIENLTVLVAQLAHDVPRLGCMLIDRLYERVFEFMDTMEREKMQEIVSLVELMGGLYTYLLIDEEQIVSLLYLFIEYGHTVSFNRKIERDRPLRRSENVSRFFHPDLSSRIL